IDIQALLPDAYLTQLYQGSRNLNYVLPAYLARINALRRRDEYDVLWVEKELFPWLPFWFERYWFNGPPVLLDFDDAIFHNYDLNKLWLVRRVLGTKIDQLMSGVEAV